MSGSSFLYALCALAAIPGMVQSQTTFRPPSVNTSLQNPKQSTQINITVSLVNSTSSANATQSASWYKVETLPNKAAVQTSTVTWYPYTSWYPYSSATSKPVTTSKATSKKVSSVKASSKPTSKSTSRRSTSSVKPTSKAHTTTVKVTSKPTSTRKASSTTKPTSSAKPRSTSSSIVKSSSFKSSSAVRSSVTPSSSSVAPSASASPMPDFWIGGNSYYLHSFRTESRLQVLNAMQSVGMKTVRIFIASVYAGNKGSNNIAMPDLEPNRLGSYDDTILKAIDQLMVECKARGMKLIISMGDRYALGFWSTDVYATTYGIVGQGTSGAQQVADATAFYTSSSAIANFDKRIQYIMNHRNSLLGNKKWSELDEAIYAFEPQNEPMGHMNFYAGWTCNRAAVIKAGLPSGSGIKVTTGGGITIQTSLQDWAFNCPSFDIVSVHDYGTDATVSVNALVAGQATAKKTGKQVIFEEWGASGQGKANVIGAFVPALRKAGIPHLIWQIVEPGAGAADFEIWTNEPSWQVFVNDAKNLSYKFSKRAMETVTRFARVKREPTVAAPLYKRSPPVPQPQHYNPESLVVAVHPARDLSHSAQRLAMVNRFMHKLF